MHGDTARLLQEQVCLHKSLSFCYAESFAHRKLRGLTVQRHLLQISSLTIVVSLKVDALQQTLPNLTPSFLPASPDRDLLRLAELEGQAGSQALLEVVLFGFTTRVQTQGSAVNRNTLSSMTIRPF